MGQQEREDGLPTPPFEILSTLLAAAQPVVQLIDASGLVGESAEIGRPFRTTSSFVVGVNLSLSLSLLPSLSDYGHGSLVEVRKNE